MFNLTILPLSLRLIHSVAASVLLAGVRQSAVPPRQGAGDLLIAPTRIVFEGAKRTAEINLLNIGDKPAMYRISLIHQRMNEDGKLEEITSPLPNERFADDLVRFTPRQVTLEPHVAQIVRVQVRLPEGLETGEYRSHMLFRAVSTAEQPTQLGDANSPPKGIDIKITPIYGVSIPVIVRHGEINASVDMSETRLESAPSGFPVIVGKMSRTGSASVYGDLWVEFAPKGGKFVAVARANGIALYSPNVSRKFAVQLSQDSSVKFGGGILRTTYRRPDSEGGQIIAKSTIELP